jgi:hypothetical protein
VKDLTEIEWVMGIAVGAALLGTVFFFVSKAQQTSAEPPTPPTLPPTPGVTDVEPPFVSGT